METKNEKIYSIPMMESYTTVRNLCNWDLYFSLAGQQNADKIIKANGTIDLLNREIKSLCDNNNVFFIGNGQGNHARVYIEDQNVRVYVNFESQDGERKQIILTDEVCQKLFDYKRQGDFEKKIKEFVITEAEKDFIMVYARKNKINDYEKISFLEEHCERKYKI